MATDRWLVSVLLLLCGGCRFEVSGLGVSSVDSAIVDLATGATDDGSLVTTDLPSNADLTGNADLTQETPVFGAACTGACTGGLTCYTMVGTGSPSPLPGGFCSKPCAGPSDCPSGVAQCGTIEGQMICVPNCAPSTGSNCRSSYSCCAGQQIVSGPGGCGPTSTNFCGN